jgi:hypothetical protein
LKVLNPLIRVLLVIGLFSHALGAKSQFYTDVLHPVSAYAEWPVNLTWSLETGAYFKPKNFLSKDLRFGTEIHFRRYKQKRFKKLSYPYKKGYYALGVRYLQRPLEDGHGAPQVSFIGFSGNLGYKVKTVKRITLDPYLGISVYPLIWNNRNPLVGGDYFSLKIGVKLGFIQKRNSFKNSGTPRFK